MARHRRRGKKNNDAALAADGDILLASDGGGKEGYGAQGAGGAGPAKNGNAAQNADGAAAEKNEGSVEGGKKHRTQNAGAAEKRAKNRARKKSERRKRAFRRAAAADEYLQQFSPDDLIEQGRALDRRFVLHAGPTNSGKTYEALRDLRTAALGVYLGPLRLLALEIFETLNMDGIACDLLTGEEYESIPGSGITSSTIELCDFDKRYDVAVIDEAQLIADPSRGASWTAAICLVNAARVHVCMAPEALPIVEKLLFEMQAPYEIKRHERLVPLEFAGGIKNLSEVLPGDAVITFSRKKVLGISAALEKYGIKSSVIYGALPPAARREETRRFAEGETSVVVATDAIGMGISLPIKRVIFAETEKYDGQTVRTLSPSEIRQIAGRAGRFGKYPLGEVLSMGQKSVIKEGLEADIAPITKLQIAFPREALEYDYPLGKLLSQWDGLLENDLYNRADMTEAEFLLKAMGQDQELFPKDMLFDLITCPVDIKSPALVEYWHTCIKAIAKGEDPEKPDFYEGTLELCELKYQAYDIYHQLLRRIGIEEDCLIEKEKLCAKINKFLLMKKKDYIRRCRICGKELSVTARFNVCDRCFFTGRFR